VSSSNSIEPVDILVVGAGIHGAGVLQAAAASGFRATMLEERAPAAGTSSRSSKLIHGGLRYLETGQLGLVRESLRERSILLRIAPELVKLVAFHVPVYRNTSRRPRTIRIGLTLYALLGNLSRAARFERVRENEWGALDGLRTEGLDAVFRYYDGQTDDASLVRAVLRSAESLGARLHCPAGFLGARRTDEGWEVRFEEHGEERRVCARSLVNAAGPWIELVRHRIDPLPPGFEVDLVAGAHAEFDGSLTRGIYYTEAPSDRRAVFVMPWKGRTLVGTTETPFRGDPATVSPLDAEVAYLAETFHHYFPARSAKTLRAWAGLRVLPKGPNAPFGRKRETRLVVDDDRNPRMVAIYGGKLTGYRATAEKVVARLARALPRRERRADTATLPLKA
jgi:glycerol-3-phosphate dehydrogenase